MKFRALFAAVAACLAASSAVAADRKPNVVFVMADDLGWADVGCFGSTYHETPNIDRLATQGVKFTNAYACGPNCQPSRAAMMSGQYGPRTGIYTVGSIERFAWRTRPLKPVDNVTALPLDVVTLGRAMKDAGYATALFGKWHLGPGPKHHPTKRGFDEAVVSAGKHFDFKTDPETEHDPKAYLADFLTDKAIDFIERKKDGPFFLALHHFGVHAPYQAKPELIAKFKAKKAEGTQHDPIYAAMLASVDESVGRVVKALDELGLADDTLVIFTSDNGGVGGYAREGIASHEPTDNAPLRGGKGMLYEGGIRVPYVFRKPGLTPAGATCETPIIGLDLYPTLLDLAGAKPSATLDGVSYAALLSDPTAKLPREALFWHFPGYLGAARGTWRTSPGGAIRSGDWKLVEHFETGKVELYNLREDVGEKVDLAAKEPSRASELKAKLTAWRASVHAPMPTPHTPDPNAKAQAKGAKGEDD